MSKEKQNNRLIVLISLFIISVVYTLLVKYVDQAAIGPNNSVVGFSSINKFFSDLLPYNELFYNISKYLGYMTFILVGFYGLIGLKQLIERKNILKIDKKILLLGLFYVLVLVVYIFFEKVIINYRPVMLENELEASFPSSHTLLALCISLSALIINKDYIKNKKILKIVDIVIIILMFLLVIFRFLSGVHWFTDIIGGIIISIFLVYLYYYMIKKFKD